MITKATNTEKFLVTQSNSIIEAEHSIKLSARGLKIVKLILALIQPDDKDFKYYKVSLNALKQYLGMAENIKWGSFYSEMNDIFKKINSEPIRLQTGKKKFLTSVFVATQEIDLIEGTVTFEIPSKLAPYLLELKNNYTSYLLTNIPKLKSFYSIRMYELLFQYWKIGRRIFQLDDLQRKVGSDYPLYGNFKVKVLKVAQRDLEKNTNIKFEYEEIKTGRKVTALEFFIYPNQPKEESNSKQGVLNFLEDATQVMEKTELSSHIAKTLANIGISEENITKYLTKGFNIISDNSKREKATQRCKNIETYYIEKMTLLKQSKEQDNPAGFFIKALKEDWQSSKLVKDRTNKAVAKKLKEARAKLKRLEQKKELLQEKYNEHRDAIFKKIIEADEVTFQRIYKETISAKFKGITKSILKPNLSAKEQYLNSPMVSSVVNIELQKNFSDKFDKLEKWYSSNFDSIESEISKLKNENPLIKY